MARSPLPHTKKLTCCCLASSTYLNQGTKSDGLAYWLEPSKRGCVFPWISQSTHPKTGTGYQLPKTTSNQQSEEAKGNPVLGVTLSLLRGTEDLGKLKGHPQKIPSKGWFAGTPPPPNNKRGTNKLQSWHILALRRSPWLTWRSPTTQQGNVAANRLLSAWCYKLLVWSCSGSRVKVFPFTHNQA